MESPALADARTLQAEAADLRARLAEAHVTIRALTERDAHLRAAMQASRVVAYHWDIAADRVTRLRSTLEPGAALEDAGGFEDIVAKVHPEDREAFRRDIDAALASPDGVYRTEVRYRRPDGELRWLSETGQVIRGDGGRAEHMVGITFDITERKQAEDALRQAEAQLRGQALRKDEFLAMLAHELRNPLAPIRNAVHILRLLGPHDAPLDDARDMIERQVGHLVRLVDDLLDVSRLSRGKITLQAAAHDLRDVVRHAVDTSQPLLDGRRHRLEVDLPAFAVPIHGDATRLAQVVSNLLNNAAKYTPQGGHIALKVWREGEQAVLSVTDTGIGIAPDALSKVFEMFAQVPIGDGRPQGGLGIGLSLVKNLVEMHGGRVSVTSDGSGHGATFKVWLPCAPGVPCVQATQAVAATTGDEARRILVVDDNVDAAESLAMLLRLRGQEVRMVHDGPAALQLCADDKPDVVLLDIGLPGMDGYEVCRQMRRNGMADARIIAMTGYGQDRDRERSREAGFDDHTVKPVEIGDLMKLIALV